MRRVSKLSSPTLFYSLLGVVFDPARCLANVQMHPSIRRDFARLGQLDHEHWQRVNSADFFKYSATLCIAFGAGLFWYSSLPRSS
jgi:hypothetical protein